MQRRINKTLALIHEHQWGGGATTNTRTCRQIQEYFTVKRPCLNGCASVATWVRGGGFWIMFLFGICLLAGCDVGGSSRPVSSKSDQTSSQTSNQTSNQAILPPENKNNAYITLKVAAFPDLDRAIKAAIPIYEISHPNVKIELSTLSFADHHQKMGSALATDANVSDVMAVEIDYIGQFGASGGLENLNIPPYSVGPEMGKLTKYMLPAVMGPDGSVSGLPADLGPGALFYRKDILDKARVTEADLTQSWASYIQAGKKIKDATGSYLLTHAADLKDVYIRSGLREGEGIYFNNAGESVVNTPRFEEAFRLAKMARDAGVDANVLAWSDEWSTGFKRDKIATQMMGAWLAGALSQWLAPESKGLWRSAQLPNGAYSYWGGSFYAIPKASTHKAQAWAFIRFMTLDKNMQLLAFKTLDAFPALVAAQHDPFVHEPIAYLGGQRARELWKTAAERTQPISVDPFDSMAKAVVSDELTNVLAHGKEIKQALSDAHNKIQAHTRR